MRLINADALLKHSARVVEYDEAGFSMEYNAVPTEVIKNAPTVEAKPVVHGEWKHRKKWGRYVCSECSHESKMNDNFCPNCGADMRGGKNG